MTDNEERASRANISDVFAFDDEREPSVASDTRSDGAARSVEREKAIDALVARLRRGDLTFFDEARVCAHITGVLALTQKELAGRLGCSQSRVANKLRLLRFTEGEREAILAGGLTERHARTLLRLPEGERAEAIERCAKRRMNVARTEEMVDAILRRDGAESELFGEGERGERRFVLGDLRFFYNSVDRAVGMLRLAGFAAEATRVEDENGVEIRIAVTKPGRFT